MAKVLVDLDETVNRFLAYKFPANINPDGGLSFDPKIRNGHAQCEPQGTNLLDATQAREMFLHIFGLK